MFWIPDVSGCQELPLVLKILMFFVALAATSLLTYAVIGWHELIIEDVRSLEWPGKLKLLAIFAIRAIFYAAAIAIWLGLLYAFLWDLGKPNRDHGDRIVPPEPTAHNALDREIFPKHGKALEEATRIVGVKHDKAHGKPLALSPKIIQFREFDTNLPGVSRLQRDPFFAIAGIGFGRVYKAPGAGFFVNSEPRVAKDPNLLLRKVHCVNKPAFSIEREGPREGDSRKTLRSVIGLHDLKGFLGDLDHLVRRHSHCGGDQQHEALDHGVKRLHFPSLASASELDRILREGLRGREG